MDADQVVAKAFSMAPDSRIENTKTVLPNPSQETGALQSILRDRMRVGQPIAAPDLPKVAALSVDGFSFPGDPMTLILYSLTKIAKTDTAIKQTLDAFSFTMKDLNGKQIYPEVNQ